MDDMIRPNHINATPSKHGETTVGATGFQLDDLVEIAELRPLLDNFCDSVGIAAAIIDLQGKVLIASRWQPICTHFHRVNKITCARCVESDTDLALHLKAGENFSVYRCKNGMADAASPVIIEGRHLANVFVGQFLLAAPDREFFARQAEQVGFDLDACLKALDEVPIIPEEKLPSILGFLSGFAKLVASMGLQCLRAERVSMELSEQQAKLELSIESRTSELALQNRILEQIGSGIPLADMLELLARQVESLHPEMRCSILLTDEHGKQLLHGAAPSLPDFYNQAVNGLEIADGKGPCGAAAYRGEHVVVEDIQQHPDCAAFRGQAARAGVRSCWSQPVKDSHGRVLGIFAVYHAKPARPSQTEITLIERYANLARLVIERKLAEQRLQLTQFAMDNASVEIFWLDSTAHIHYANDQVCKTLGYTKEELLQLSIPDLDPLFPIDHWNEHWQSLKRDKTQSFETKHRRKNGELFPSEVVANYVKFDNLEYNVAFSRDISERKRAEDILRESEEKYRLLTENSNEVIWTLDPQTLHFLYVSPSVFKLRGYTPEEVIAEPMDAALTAEGAAYVRSILEQRTAALRSGAASLDKFYFDEIEQPCKDGSMVWTEVVTNFYLNKKTNLFELRGVTRDITERKKAEEIIRNLAFYDSLTQLPNRRMLGDRLTRTLALSKRSGRYGALMFLDLDNFKPLNDQYGHSAGDLLLIEVGRRLTSCVREADTVARFGGDEFVVMLGELDEDQAAAASQASVVAEKILAILAEPYVLGSSVESVGDLTAV